MDTLAAAMDWLDAYRGQSLDIVDMYERNATIKCGCNGVSLAGLAAIEIYWTERFRQHPALELVDLRPTDDGAVLVSYRTRAAIVKAVLAFDRASARIAWQSCGQDAAITRLVGRNG